MMCDTIVYRDTLGHGTIHNTLSLCIMSSRYIVKLSLMYENSHRIVKLFANIPKLIELVNSSFVNRGEKEYFSMS